VPHTGTLGCQAAAACPWSGIVITERRPSAVPGGDALAGASCRVPGGCLGLVTAAGKKKADLENPGPLEEKKQR